MGLLVCARQGPIASWSALLQHHGVGTVTHFKARRLGEAEGLNLLSLPKRTYFFSSSVCRYEEALAGVTISC